MRHLHSLRIFHRDLKCPNVLLDDERRPLITDLGCAKFVGDESMTGQLGSPYCLAPEVWFQSTEYGFPADVYSYSIIFYELVEQRLGHVARTDVAEEYMRHVAAGVRPIPELASDAQRLLLASMWSTNPSHRPTFWDICDLLEDVSGKYWIEGTDAKAFLAYKAFLDANEKGSQRQVTVSPQWLMKSSKWEAIEEFLERPDVLMSGKVSFLIAHLTTQDDDARAELQDALNGCFRAHGRLDAQVMSKLVKSVTYVPHEYGAFTLAPVTGAMLSSGQVACDPGTDTSGSRVRFKGSHTSVPGDLAITLIRPNFGSWDDSENEDLNRQICRFFREIFTQIYCAHPGIIPLVGWNVWVGADPQFVIATRWIEGRPLRIGGRLTRTEKRIILYGVARALGHLEVCRVVHRNLKPSSVLIEDRTVYPRLGDFWYAKYLVDEEGTRMKDFTIYTAPELYTAGKYTSRGDVYSYAMMFCAVLSGREWEIVHDGDQLIDGRIQRRILDGERPVAANATAKQVSLLARMWATNPDDRPSFANILVCMEAADFWERDAEDHLFDAYRQLVDRGDAGSLVVTRPAWQDYLVQSLSTEKFLSATSHLTNGCDFIELIAQSLGFLTGRGDELNTRMTDAVRDSLWTYGTLWPMSIDRYVNGFLSQQESVPSSSPYRLSRGGADAAAPSLPVADPIPSEELAVPNVPRIDTQDQRYRFSERLGRGTSGDVKLFEDVYTGRLLVGKFVTLPRSLSGDFSAAFVRELSLQAGFAHRAILPVIGWNAFRSGGNETYVLVTPFMGNGALRIGPESAKLSPTEKLIIMYGVAHGMQYFHSHDCIHRDLKPSNILLDDMRYPLIGDLGLARLASADPNMTLGVGTTAYMASEMLSGTQGYGSSVDVYSYGVLCSELLQDTRWDPEVEAAAQLTTVTDAQRRLLLLPMLSKDAADRPSFGDIVTSLEDDRFWPPNVERTDFKIYRRYVAAEGFSLAKPLGASLMCF
jgi:serine/threonine protein kinase